MYQYSAYLRIAPITIWGDLVEIGWAILLGTSVFSMNSTAAICHGEGVIMAATVGQSSMRRRQSIARCLRGKCMQARWLAQVGCCVRAIAKSMVDGVNLRRVSWSSWMRARERREDGESLREWRSLLRLEVRVEDNIFPIILRKRRWFNLNRKDARVTSRTAGIYTLPTVSEYILIVFKIVATKKKQTLIWVTKNNIIQLPNKMKLFG